MILLGTNPRKIVKKPSLVRDENPYAAGLKTMTSSKILFCCGISFTIGIGIASFFNIGQLFILATGMFGIFLVALSLRKNSALVAGLCLIFLACGFARFHITELSIIKNPLRQYNDTNKIIEFTGNIITDPDVRDASQKLTIESHGSKILVTVRRSQQYHYLDTIRVGGQLKTPVAPDENSGFDYQKYLMKDGIYSVMDFPEVTLISHKTHYNLLQLLYKNIFFIKGKMRRSIDENFPPPHKFLLYGVILDNNKIMPQDLRDKFSATGLRHLTGVSGEHVVVISDMAVSLLLFFGLRRKAAVTGSLMFIWLYVILIGFPAAAIRAAVMGSLLLCAGIFGRQNTSSRTIVLATTLMLLQNPMLLRYDVGFQLSFLASLGIIHLKPLLSLAFHCILKDPPESWNLWPKMQQFIVNRKQYFLDIISVTITAQIFTLPVMIFAFSNVSLIAPLANLLVIPTTYWLTIFGFLSALLGIFSGFLGWIFSLPVLVLSAYFLKIMDILSQPWANKTIPNVSWIWLMLYYVILFLVVWWLKKRQKLEFLP